MLNKITRPRRTQAHKGFSVVEVVICISIISVGMMAVFTLLIQNVQVQSLSKNKLIASMLAQEGVELVREIRDNNWLKKRGDETIDWALGDNVTPDYENIAPGSGKYIIDIKENSINNTIANINDSAAKLYLQNGRYVHDSVNASSTPFFRLIRVVLHDVDSDGGDESIELISDVMWMQNGQEKHYIVETRLFDWVQ